MQYKLPNADVATSKQKIAGTQIVNWLEGCQKHKTSQKLIREFVKV